MGGDDIADIKEWLAWVSLVALIWGAVFFFGDFPYGDEKAKARIWAEQFRKVQQ